MESVVSDTDGQFVTGSLQDYAMPRASDFPAFINFHGRQAKRTFRSTPSQG
jgi:CO/xanthine dehydrogenase Mo-binding subunit